MNAPADKAVVLVLNGERKGQQFAADTIKDLQAKWAEFRDGEGFGASECSGGTVLGADDEVLGTISYNGRFFPKETE